jgi:dihydrofolate reductase
VGKLVISTNTTLDGVVLDPDGKEGFDRGGWFARYGGDDLAAWAELGLAEAKHADALLLGRRSDEWFAARWPGRDGEWADILNAMPKYVVSTTTTEPQWSNATLLGDDWPDRVASIKRAAHRDVLVYASRALGRTLLDRDLVDELRLVVFPVVLGAGDRLFGQTDVPKALRLLSHRTLGSGLAFLNYEVQP